MNSFQFSFKKANHTYGRGLVIKTVITHILCSVMAYSVDLTNILCWQ